MSKTTDRKMVRIEWVDSCTQSSWRTESNIEECDPTPVVTVGLLVFEDKKKIVVAHSHSLYTDEFNSPVHIPKCCIRKRRFLK